MSASLAECMHIIGTISRSPDFISTCMSVVGGYSSVMVNVTQKCMTVYTVMYLYVLTLWICHNSSREFLKEEKVQRL